MGGGTTRMAGISLESMVPDVLTRYPQVRPVLDRYGLHGCGGRLGPVETLEFFARAHGVDEDRLLAEIRQAATVSLPIASTGAELSLPRLEDSIYRRFFEAGIALILTAGATWGALLLWKIGLAGKFTGVSIHEVNAHGHAQIFGWVGLFIMGFAYQAFPRIWHTRLAAPRLAVATFVTMVVGMIVASVAMTQAGRAWAAPLALAGGLLELAAIAAFVGQILTTFRRSEARLEPYVGFVTAALIWFVAMSAMSTWHTWTTMTAGSKEALLFYVKAYQAPLRDLQIHGLALFMILGVCLRMLPGLFNVPKVPERRAWRALAVLTVGLLGEVGLFVAYAWTGNHVMAAFLMIPWLLLAAGIVMVAWPWRLWRPMPVADRSAKFVRAGYGWLAISMIMLLLLPVYQWVSGIPFSHAYYGAIRHAITVGFISMMIMGFAAKVVPTLNGRDPRQLTELWGPFVLVNLGCFLRCSMQTLTDWHPGFFALVGVSGTLEVTGLAWWGIGLIRIMVAGKREQRALGLAESPSGPVPARIEAEHRVYDVLTWFPATLEVFNRYGFTLLNNPWLRRTLARQVSVRQAAMLRSVDLEALLEDLRAAAQTSSCTSRCDGCGSDHAAAPAVVH